MIRRLTQEMRCKIVVWQEAYESVMQTQHLFNKEFFNREFKFFLPELRNNASIENCHFQQHGAPAHYATKVRGYLNQLFPDRWIGRRGSLKWAARSPDLTPCDFFLWGFLKGKVYSTCPQNLEELKQKIRVSCGQVTEDLSQNIGQKCVKRWPKCLEIGGSHVKV